ncbi:sensor histidine kinase [Phenylobacterium koreense]|uniref:histidine kinase n=1 Tax=Phenylobacterium koreense TaxID=266125 RepID=A0ABV2ELP2_9CAUL
MSELLAPSADLEPAPAQLAVQALGALGGALTGLILALDRLDRTRGLLYGVLDTLPQGVAIYDPDHRLIAANASYTQAFDAIGAPLSQGMSYEAILGRLAASGMFPSAGDREKEWVAEQLNLQPGDSSQREQVLSDGRIMRVANQRLSDGVLVTAVSDITAHRRQAEELAAARAAADVASRAKDEFLAIMSHEFRTPLNGILVASELLRSHPLPEGQADLVGVIHSSGEGLNRLVGDLLDVVSLDAERLDVAPAPFDLRSGVTAIFDLFAPQARDKRLAATLRFGRECDGAVFGDERRLKQILAALLSNAVKFTDRGEISISITRREQQVSFAVIDTGVGFDEADARRIFERFEQGDPSATRRHGGAGLGLMIARALATRMGGSIEAASAPGAGSVFTLVLPLPRHDPLSSHQERPSADLEAMRAEDRPTGHELGGWRIRRPIGPASLA